MLHSQNTDAERPSSGSSAWTPATAGYADVPGRSLAPSRALASPSHGSTVGASLWAPGALRGRGGAWTPREAKKHQGEVNNCAFVALGKFEEADLEGEGAESEMRASHAKLQRCGAPDADA